MYLIELDEDTGLIKDDPTNDGWKGISVFRKVVKKYGIEGLTLIALSIDYQSPYKHYSDKDRPFRSMDEIYGTRSKFNYFENELFLEGHSKYKELQFNPDLEQDKINNEIKLRYLNKLSEANDNNDDDGVNRYNISLRKHQEHITNFNKTFSKEKSLELAVTKNGYSLSRIERDIVSRKNSKFANNGSDVKNPDKLGLEK